MLGRQWQIGEFRGEDAGTPIAVQISGRSQSFTAWRPGPAAAANGPAKLDPDKPLEAEVEREGTSSSKLGMRQKAEAGSLLVSALADAGVDLRAALLKACPLQVDVPPPSNPAPAGWDVDPLWRVIARSTPDGLAAAMSLESGTADWLAGASSAATDAAANWLMWFRNQVAPDESTSAWVSDQLEYQFALRAGSGDQQLLFEAPSHDGGPVDWYSFDYAPAGRINLDGDAPSLIEKFSSTVLATPLRYAGMPADRLWQFEEGSVNFGQINVQIHDPARLCFIEFASIFGNDWFSVPLDLPSGSFNEFDEVSYTTTFGDRFIVPMADDSKRSGHFRMFGVSIAGQAEQAKPGLFVPPPGRRSQTGRALEEIMFVRDESANMAWAIEKKVQGRSGDPRNRADEQSNVRPLSALQAGAELRYTLETTVPSNWIPLVPVPVNGDGGFKLRKGTMTDSDQSMSEILSSTPFDLHEEEVLREGLRVSRVPILARTATGRTVRWVARESGVGRGEAASRLAFDGTT